MGGVCSEISLILKEETDLQAAALLCIRTKELIHVYCEGGEEEACLDVFHRPRHVFVIWALSQPLTSLGHSKGSGPCEEVHEEPLMARRSGRLITRIYRIISIKTRVNNGRNGTWRGNCGAP